MTPAAFKTKWQRFSGKETAAYQEHFNDLCRLLRQPTPAEADPTGNDTFCFQKYVLKDAELFSLLPSGEAAPDAEERGFADVWKSGCFAWEYKGKRKNLEDAYKQLLRYRESLLNPPLLVVCDFDRYVVRTNFNGTVQETHEFTNAEIDTPRVQHILRSLFSQPDALKPQRTTAQVTEKLAAQMAEIARSLQSRESVELDDAKSRREVNVAQRKNLRIARFLNRVVFCLFAEDTGLLPENIFSEVARTGLDDPRHFAESLEELFRLMATGGRFGNKKIRHFNGHLFEEATVFELTADELRQLAEAAEADWQFIEPSIMGTLFERALEPGQRSQLGAHYTSETDIKTLVEPVLMAPLRREWTEIKAELLPTIGAGKAVARRATAAQRERLADFQNKLSALTVLDPACGSGNFLYVSLQLLLGLEKEVIAHAEQLGCKLSGPKISVQQLRAIELNPYAFELAQVAVQIGYLQWRRDNGFDNDRSPVLQNLDGFQNEDALLVPHFRSKAKTLKEAQAGEHKGSNALKFYTEREWQPCDVIVGNPPFLGGSKLWEELGRDYQSELWRIYEGRVPGGADLCCYWFEKARKLVADGKCKRAGLLATQAIRGGVNREVLKQIKQTGDIFFGVADRNWILNGAMVHVSMIGFDAGTEEVKLLDSKPVSTIHANLTGGVDTTKAAHLSSMLDVAFIGTKKAGKFELSYNEAVALLPIPNPHGLPNSDVLRPWLDGAAISKRPGGEWIIDCGTSMTLDTFGCYEAAFKRVLRLVKPDRDKNNRKAYRDKWWLHAETRPGLRRNCLANERYLATVRHSKHRIFVWVDGVYLPDDGIFTFARTDDYFFGVLHSLLHEVWSLAQGTQVREKESGFRYTPSSCFETFPFPSLTPTHETTIAAAAKELNTLRERWLNPPEWTQTAMLVFPGSGSGPWANYIDPSSVDPQTGIGTVRYPRLEPRDADFAAKLKTRTLTNLYNERPAWLDMAHKKLDAAVAAAYGWPADLGEEEILARLLERNLARAAEETATGKPARSHVSREKDPEELL